MGLEMVEFVMELEDRFDVEIPDAELDGVYTFGDFYRLICAKTNPTDEPGPCPTPGVFLRLRTALCEVVGVRSSRIRPDTPLVELIPPETRLAAWPKLEHAMGLKLSPLSKPEWVHSWAAGGGCLGVILGCILAGVVAWWMLPIVWALAGAWVTVWELRTGHLALELPPHIRTVGDLVKSTVGLNLPRPDTGRAPSREAIWQGIVDVAVEELQSPVEYVRPDVIISDVADWYPPPGVDYRGHAAKPPRTHPGGIAVDLDLPLRRPNIVLDLEYDCGVRLSGHELLSAHTVWDLYQLTLSRRGLTASQPNECPSSEVFNALRRALIDGFGVSRSSVGLDARMEDLVPARRRRKAWAAIREATGLRLPQLEPSPNATGNAEGLGCLFGVPPAFIGVLLGAAGMSDGGLGAFGGGLAVAGVSIAIGAGIAYGVYHSVMAAAGLDTRTVPESCGTLAGLVRETVALNYNRLADGTEGAETLRIWDRLLAVVAKHCPSLSSGSVRGSTLLEALGRI